MQRMPRQRFTSKPSCFNEFSTSCGSRGVVAHYPPGEVLNLIRLDRGCGRSSAAAEHGHVGYNTSAITNRLVLLLMSALLALLKAFLATLRQHGLVRYQIRQEMRCGHPAERIAYY